MDILLRFIADGLLIIILVVSGGLTLWAIRRDSSRYLPVIIMAGLSALLAGKLMSLVYQPDAARPFIEAGVAAGASYVNNPGFPSDHALLGTIAVITLWAVSPRYRSVAYVLGLLVIVMCIGRVVALVHTPLDVIGGAVAAIIGSLWYKKLTR